MSVYNGDRYDGLMEYMVFGGLPLVVLAKTREKKMSLLENLFSEIYLKDILNRYSVRNVNELEELLDILSSSIGSLTNPQKLSKTFHSKKNSKITEQTIRKYISYFEDAFLLESASRYDVKGKQYIDTPKKYYFTDLGLRNARLNFRQFEQTHTMENLIYIELCRCGYRVDVGIVPISTKDTEGKSIQKQLEVDFICNLGSKRFYIQSAYSLADSLKRQQEIRPFLKIKDAFKRILITMDHVHMYYDDNGILTMNLYDFLSHDNSLEMF